MEQKSQRRRSIGRWRHVLVAATLAVIASATGTPATAEPSGGPIGEPATTDIGLDLTTMMTALTPSALTAYIQAKGGHAAAAVHDQATGASVAVNQDRTFQTASIVKFDILATRLYQHQQAKTRMSAGEKRLAHAMITQSDNNAASALYSMDHGASGVRAANRVFGLTSTTPGSAWGRTRTTPADQIRLLTAVMGPSSRLTSTNRDYVLSLMSHVEKDQAWGITAAATPDATGVYVKNGWVQMSAYGGMEGDNSIGRIVEPGHDWLIAVMSNYNKSDKAGEAILGDLATIAVEGLRMQTSHPGR